MTGLLRRVLKSHHHGTEGVVTVTFLPNGRLVTSGAINGEIQMWEVATCSYCRALKGNSDYMNALTFSLNSRLVASASDGGKV